MKITSIVFNLLLLAFVVLLMMEEGSSSKTPYVIFGILLLVVPALNLVFITLKTKRPEWFGTSPEEKVADGVDTSGRRSAIPQVMNVTGIVWNFVLLAYTVWAIIDQYPHPDESGVALFELVAVLTPILSAIVFAQDRSKNRPVGSAKTSLT